MRTLALVLLLLATPVYANTLYSYVGDTFRVVEGAYSLADHVTGSFTMLDGFLPQAALDFDEATWRAGVAGWSFTDGHQTLTDENSTSARIIWWETGTGASPAWALDFSNALGGLSTIRLGDYGDSGRIVGSGFGFNHNVLPNGGLPGTWTIQTIQTPELAIIHLPRLLKWGIGLGLEARVTHVLQHATARLAATILWAPRDGVFIDLPHARIEVAEACSGIATLVFLLGVAGLIAVVKYGGGRNEDSQRMRSVRSPALWRRSPLVVSNPDRGDAAPDQVSVRLLASSVAVIVLFLAAALLALEANALRVVLIALGGEHREVFQYATTALAVGQLVALARLCRTS